MALMKISNPENRFDRTLSSRDELALINPVAKHSVLTEQNALARVINIHAYCIIRIIRAQSRIARAANAAARGLDVIFELSMIGTTLRLTVFGNF